MKIKKNVTKEQLIELGFRETNLGTTVYISNNSLFGDNDARQNMVLWTIRIDSANREIIMSMVDNRGCAPSTTIPNVLLKMIQRGYVETSKGGNK